MTRTLLDCIDAAPDNRLAVIDDHQQRTYAELRRNAKQVAGSLHARFGAGNYLVLKAETSVPFVERLLAAMYSGNTPIPVAPDLPQRDVDYVRQKSNAVAVIDSLDPSSLAGAQPIDCRDDTRPAMILFTSGTTGFPKGVIISHENLMHSCDAISEYLGYHEHRSAAVVLPLHYSYALLSQVCCQLFVGGLIRLFASFRNPIKFSRAVNELELATFCGVPSTYHALVTVHGLSKLEIPSIRVLCSAGAAMNRGIFSTTKEIFPNARFFNNYGMTEAAPRISYICDEDPRFHEATCGRPMKGLEVKVVDPQSHEDLPDGQPGMLVLKGPNVTSGYLNDPERTSEAFTKDGFLISNDIAYLDQGCIFICGRHDDIFNVAGEKVAPLEIERVLNELPMVLASAVCGVEDEQRGLLPVAFLKLHGPAGRKEILAELNGNLPPIKIPQRLFEVSGFPLTANGKLKRKELSPDDPSYVIREID